MKTINEKRLNQIIKENINKILNESKYYHLSDLDELMEYMWIKPRFTNLNVDLFVDDGGSFIRHNHPLLLFARNGYSKEANQFIPFSIEEKPCVMDDEIDFNISYDDIFAIQDFIQANLDLLIGLSERRIKQEDFVMALRHNFAYTIAESRKILVEMSTLRKDETNLPMDIWVDEGATFQGHAPRLKFRASNEQRTTREYSSMLLTNPPSTENVPDNSPLRKRDMEKLERFVINNLELLLKLANGEIDFTTEFKPNMILE